MQDYSVNYFNSLRVVIVITNDGRVIIKTDIFFSFENK